MPDLIIRKFFSSVNLPLSVFFLHLLTDISVKCRISSNLVFPKVMVLESTPCNKSRGFSLEQKSCSA